MTTNRRARPASRPQRPGSPPSARAGRRRATGPVAAAVTILVLLAAGAAAPAASQQLPDTVTIAAPGLHPEGVEWDTEVGRFLVSSVTRGTVTAVRDGGSYATVVDDPQMQSSIGVHVDEERKRILVAEADLSAIQGAGEGTAILNVYDLLTSQRLVRVDLGELYEGRHFANDVTVGPDGAAYVTDSFSPVIYRVTTDGEASVFVEDERLGTEGFGLNGIDHHPDGYLLVAVAGRRTLMKVPVDAPGSMTEVELPEPFAADGLTLRPDGSLVAVAQTGSGDRTKNEALLLRSDDGWASARIADRAPAPGATTAAVRDGAVYVVNPRFADMGGEQAAREFHIYRVGIGR